MQPNAEVARRWWQFSLLALLVVVTLIAVGAAGFFFVANREQFRFRKVVTTLYQDVRRGDSPVRLQELLGIGREADVAERAAFSKIWDTSSLPGGPTFPDGYQTTDALLVYNFDLPACKTTMYFQFRDGKLINHNPLDYKDMKEPTLTSVY